MFDAIVEFLKQNELASGGLVVVLFGSVGYMLRQLPGRISLAIKRRVILSIEILDNDESFRWISRWLAEHEYVFRSRRISVLSRPIGDEGVPIVVDASSAERSSASREIRYVPSPGWHLLRIFGSWFIVVRARSEPQPGGGRGMLRYENFVFHTLAWNRSKAIRLIREARDLTHPPGEDRVSIYNGTHSWQYLGDVPSRPIETVVLPGGIEREILADVQTFLERREWYAARSISYHRGYLLHGLPGNGKTSLILAIASCLKMNVGLLSLTHTDVDDARLLGLLAACSQYRLIAVVEDIDGVFDKERKRVESTQRLTYSGLLNAIDGVASPQGQLLFMTTNHRERIDDSLLRPGRVDVDIEMGNATPEQIQRLAALILGNDVVRHTQIINDLLQNGSLSMAAAQQALFACTDQHGRSFKRRTADEGRRNTMFARRVRADSGEQDQ